MTDITTTTPIPHPPVPLRGTVALRCPRGLRCALGVIGKAIVSLLVTYTRALETAYAAPFRCPQQTRSLVCDDAQEARDPNW